MNAPVRKPKMTLAEFLTFEEAASERHEFVGGEVFAVQGHTLGQSLIKGNIAFALRKVRVLSGCRAYVASIKVITPASNVYYPDCMVICEPVSPSATWVERPVLIAQVLSPSTVDYDLGPKRLDYETIPSLAHYLVVWSDEIRVELWTRSAEGWEVVTRRAADEAVTLSGLGGLVLPLAEIYEDIDFTTPPAEAAA